MQASAKQPVQAAAPRSAMAGGPAEAKRRKSLDQTSEKVVRTTTFSPSTEATQVAIDEQSKMKAPPMPKGIVATLFNFNPLTMGNPFQGGKVDSIVVTRKRRHMREEEPRPFPVQPCLAVCLTVSLVTALVVYVLTGSATLDVPPTKPAVVAPAEPGNETKTSKEVLALDDGSTQEDVREEDVREKDSADFLPAEGAVSKTSDATNETASTEREDSEDFTDTVEARQ